MARAGHDGAARAAAAMQAIAATHAECCADARVRRGVDCARDATASGQRDQGHHARRRWRHSPRGAGRSRTRRRPRSRAWTAQVRPRAEPARAAAHPARGDAGHPRRARTTRQIDWDELGAKWDATLGRRPGAGRACRVEPAARSGQRDGAAWSLTPGGPSPEARARGASSPRWRRCRRGSRRGRART